MSSPAAVPARCRRRRRDRCAGRGALRLVLRRAAVPGGGRGVRRPVAPRRRPGLAGPTGCTWLHDLTTQYFLDLPQKTWTQALILSPQGHVEHAFAGLDDGESFTAATEPGAAGALVEFLDRMRFMSRVEVADVTAELALTFRRDRRTRADPARPAHDVRRGGRAGLRPLGLRGAADRARRAAPGPRHRPAHDPQRGRLDRDRRPHGQGLLPRPGDGRAGPQPRPTAASADPAAPRRLGEPAARGRYAS